MFQNNLLMGAASAGGVELVEVENSTLFSAADQKLNRTQAAGSNTVWTFSSWLYKCKNKNQVFLNSGTGSAQGQLGFSATGQVYIYNGSTVVGITTQVFRGIGWYHIHLAYNTGESGTDKVKLSVNGSLVTTWSTDARSSAGAFTDMNQNTKVITVGNNISADTLNFDGYMAETVILDGTASAVTNFGEYDETGLYWTPKSSDDIKALTFGTNGFYLDNTTNAQTDAHIPAPAVVLPTVTFDGTNDYLSYSGTPMPDGPAGTFSCWFRFDAARSGTDYFYQSGGTYFDIRRNEYNKLSIIGYTSASGYLFSVYSSSATWGVVSSGWHHIVISWNLVASPVCHMYIDGVSDVSIQSINAGNINYAGSGNTQKLGAGINGSDLFPGQMAQFYLTNEYVDITSATNLAKFITTDGNPVSMGTDGATPTGTAAKLFFNSAVDSWHTNDGTGGGMTEVGALTAGSAVQSVNSNSFINNNTVVTTTHTPTNSETLFNPINTTYTNPASASLSNGNRTFYSAGGYRIGVATLNFPTTGKWWVAVEYATSPAMTGTPSIGITRGAGTSYAADSYLTYQQTDYSYSYIAATIRKGSASGTTTTTGLTALAVGDFMLIAFDADNQTVKWYLENSLLYTLDLSSAPDGYYGNDGGWSFAISGYVSSGPKPTLVNTANYGYTPPTGYEELNTTNIAAATTRTETVNDHFQTQLVAHDGSSTAFTLGWNADTYQTLFIAKNRASTEKWFWVDGVRGYNKYFSSDTGTAQTTDANVISVSGTTITLGSTLASAAYVVECFRLGTSSVAADAGTINAVVSVNTVMNWSVILYTGNNAASQTVEHGLSGTPKMFIGENVGGTTAGGYYFEALGNTAIMGLNTANAKSTSVTYFQNTSPTSSVISVGANATFNASGNENWLFAVGSGSDFVANGSYEGNGNANGTFIPTIGGNGIPLQPLFALQLSIDSSGARMMHDSKREGYNVDNDELSFESTGAEGTANQIDIVSGGIKNRIATDPNVAETNVYFAVGSPIIDVDGRIIAGR